MIDKLEQIQHVIFELRKELLVQMKTFQKFLRALMYGGPVPIQYFILTRCQ